MSAKKNYLLLKKIEKNYGKKDGLTLNIIIDNIKFNNKNFYIIEGKDLKSKVSLNVKSYSNDKLSKYDIVVIKGDIIETNYGIELSTKENFIKIDKESLFNINDKKDSDIIKILGITGNSLIELQKYLEKSKFSLFDILSHQPELLLDIKGFGQKKVEKLVESFIEVNSKGFLEDFIYLQNADFSKNDILNILKEYKNKEYLINPYYLLDIDGISLNKCDSLAKILKVFDVNNEKRIEGVIKNELLKYSISGNSYMIDLDLSNIIKKYGITKDFSLMINKLKSLKKIIVKGNKIYLKSIFDKERFIEKSLKEWSKIKNMYPKHQILEYLEDFEKIFKEETGFTMNSIQKEGIIEGVSKNILLLTGPAGSGKTTIMEGILYILERFGENVSAIAPTGLASKVLSDVLDKETSTIHSFLGLSVGDFNFIIKDKKYLNYNAVIIDEFSMVNYDIAYEIFNKLNKNQRIILVGDHYQIPGIGTGNIIKDILSHNLIPFIKLDKVYRNNSNILGNASKILNGEINLENNENFSIKTFEKVDFDNINSSIRFFYDNLKKELDKYNWDFRKTQIISPVKKEFYGINNLNKIIQEKINKNNETIYETKFKKFFQNDKVMFMKNNKKEGYVNGDLGFIIDVNEIDNEFIVEINGENKVFSLNSIKDLELAYSITIHKSQGSGFQNVIISLFEIFDNMLYRELFYTAITRARENISLIGTDKAKNIAIQNIGGNDRKTTLGIS